MGNFASLATSISFEQSWLKLRLSPGPKRSVAKQKLARASLVDFEGSTQLPSNWRFGSLLIYLLEARVQLQIQTTSPNHQLNLSAPSPSPLLPKKQKQNLKQRLPHPLPKETPRGENIADLSELLADSASLGSGTITCDPNSCERLGSVGPDWLVTGGLGLAIFRDKRAVVGIPGLIFRRKQKPPTVPKEILPGLWGIPGLISLVGKGKPPLWGDRCPKQWHCPFSMATKRNTEAILGGRGQ